MCTVLLCILIILNNNTIEYSVSILNNNTSHLITLIIIGLKVSAFYLEIYKYEKYDNYDN